MPARIWAGSIQSKQYHGDVGAAGKTQKAQHYSQNFATFNFYFSTQPPWDCLLDKWRNGGTNKFSTFLGLASGEVECVPGFFWKTMSTPTRTQEVNGPPKNLSAHYDQGRRASSSEALPGSQSPASCLLPCRHHRSPTPAAKGLPRRVGREPHFHSALARGLSELLPRQQWLGSSSLGCGDPAGTGAAGARLRESLLTDPHAQMPQETRKDSERREYVKCDSLFLDGRSLSRGGNWP